MATYAQTLEVNFGTAYTGLATVAYKLVKRSDGSLLLDWTTTGVSEAESGSGMYKVSASLDDGWGTRVRWRSAETDGVFAGEDVSPLGLLPTAAAVAALPTNTQMEARTIASASYALEATLTAIKGATWSASTDTLEALRDRGDAAWITATGFPTLAEMNARTLVASAYATATALAEVKVDTAAILADTGSDGVVVASASKTGYALSATGLDQISAAEPTTKPTTFVGWVMWLVQRMRRASKTPTTVLVKTEAGATVTTQAITDDGAGTETLGAPS